MKTGWRSCPPRVAAQLRRADLILHAGDVCTAGVMDELAAYAPVLPEDLRIQAPAWDLEGLDHYLPATSASGENVTEPIDAATIGPLLVWAVRFVEEFSGDVLAARAE